MYISIWVDKSGNPYHKNGIKNCKLALYTDTLTHGIHQCHAVLHDVFIKKASKLGTLHPHDIVRSIFIYCWVAM